MQVLRWSFLLFLTSVTSFASVEANAASFTFIGGLRNPVNSAALGVSADGSTVVGRSASLDPFGQVAASWTQPTGIQSIGDFAGGAVNALANDVSGDGSVAVGGGNNADFRTEAFRYDTVNGIVGLGWLPATTSSVALGVSDDGSKIVGISGGGSNQGFIWDAINGMQDLGDLPGGTTATEAYDISGDGSTVVGSGNSANGAEAFRWDATNGIVGLGDLPGGVFASFASGVSADGSIIVGRASSALGQEATIWDVTNGTITGLGDLPGGAAVNGFFSEANGVSADGSVVVGRGTIGITNPSTGVVTNALRATIWDAQNGLRELSVVLAAAGIDLTGITLTSATGVSADGLTVVGTASWTRTVAGRPTTTSEGFVAVIPEPGTALLMGLGLAGLAIGKRRA